MYSYSDVTLITLLMTHVTTHVVTHGDSHLVLSRYDHLFGHTSQIRVK